MKKDIENIMLALNDLKMLFLKEQATTKLEIDTHKKEVEAKYATKESTKYVRLLVYGFAGLMFVAVATEMIGNAIAQK